MKKDNKYFFEYVQINNIKQYLLHYCSRPEQPVILFLHGGPGMAESTFAYAFQEHLSDLFNVVYWDQRGAGKTLTKTSIKEKYPSVEELLEDLLEVVKYLKETYNKEKIIILGHSWGSFLGSLFVQKHPEEVLYYIGAGQVIDFVENEKVGYDKLKELINNANNKKDLEALKNLGVYPERKYDKLMKKKIQKIRILQGKYRIGMDFIPIMRTLFKSPIFKLSDILSLLNGMNNNQRVWDFLYSHSLYEESRDYKVPVFYVLGDRDFQAPNTVAASYFDTINAKNKKIFFIENAGHFMMLDQPKLFADSLTEIQNCINKT